MKFRAASDSSLLVYFGDEIAPGVHQRVAGMLRALERHPFPGLRNLHPGYASLLIVFDPLTTRHKDVERAVSELSTEEVAAQPRTIEIPVHYGGPDLRDVANHCGLSEGEVAARHAGAIYLVYFIGFVPGFAYLGGLPKELETPRLPSPRKRVEAGSVGIAGNQTGVYPAATPGGWRLIGHTQTRMFEGTSLLETGDYVRFIACD